MLDQRKLLKEFEQLPHLFSTIAHEIEQARCIWQQIADDVNLYDRLQAMPSPYPLPQWQGALNQTIDSGQVSEDYDILAVDGSQLYPDRHQGLPCYLINIGYVLFRYGSTSSFERDSTPFLGLEVAQEVSPEIINCLRTERELQAASEYARKFFIADKPQAFLFDGSLIFWHLAGKDPALFHRFFTSYTILLDQLTSLKLLHAGYISLPKSKEIINCLRRAGQLPALQQKVVDFNYVVDTDVMAFFLPPRTRTVIFAHSGTIVDYYPSHLRPYFFYLHTGYEIARIEIPAWIAQSPRLVESLCSIILDQCQKGQGYPVALAEAHEQAVVKNADRQLFYHMLEHMMNTHQQYYARSIKSMHKRKLAV